MSVRTALLIGLLLAAPAAARKQLPAMAPPPIPLAEQGLVDNVTGYTIGRNGEVERFTGMLIDRQEIGRAHV